MHASIAAKTALALMAAGFTATLAAPSAQAATLAGLQDGNTIVWIDTDKKKVTGWKKLVGGASLVGFDVRPWCSTTSCDAREAAASGTTRTTP